jgi:hypothetical protein
MSGTIRKKPTLSVCREGAGLWLAALVTLAVGYPTLLPAVAQQPGTRLKGGVDEAARLNPSIKVVPAGLSGHVIQQFAGKGTYAPGQAAPVPVVPVKPKTPVTPPPPPLQQIDESGALIDPLPPPPPPAKPKAPPPPPPKPFTATPSSGTMNWTGAPNVLVVSPLARPGKAIPKRIIEPRVVTRTQIDWKTAASSGKAADGSADPNASRSSIGHAARAPGVVPLMATPQLFPGAASMAVAAPANWPDWYKRVSHTIYDQWQRASAGPGTARVRVTVFRTNDVDCQIVDFVPAADVKRDAAAETAFRESAIRSIYALRKCQILGFPYQSTRTKVCFEMNMQRTVNGPAGCEIALQDVDTEKQ